jgi:hypothetical protein
MANHLASLGKYVKGKAGDLSKLENLENEFNALLAGLGSDCEKFPLVCTGGAGGASFIAAAAAKAAMPVLAVAAILSALSGGLTALEALAGGPGHFCSDLGLCRPWHPCAPSRSNSLAPREHSVAGRNFSQAGARRGSQQGGQEL